jgi:hypothetical protein
LLIGLRIADERDAMENLKSELQAKTIDLNATTKAERQDSAAKGELTIQASGSRKDRGL